MSQDWAYTSVVWSSTLSTIGGITKDNITSLYIALDNWFNDTSDITQVYFEFWNLSSLSWTLISAAWQGAPGTALADDDDDLQVGGSLFSGTITDTAILSDIIDLNMRVSMRMRVATPVGTDVDIKVFLDYINITSDIQYFYTASVTLDSAMNGEKAFNLNPTALSAWTMRYWIIINIDTLPEIYHSDYFALKFFIRNANSTINFESYRLAPIVLEDKSTAARKWENYKLYSPSEEVLDIQKNFTFYSYDTNPVLTELLTLENINTIGLASDSIFGVKTKVDFRLNATLDLDTLNITNPNLYYRFEYRRGTKTPRVYSTHWSDISPVQDFGNVFYNVKDLDSNDEYGVYYGRFFIRNPFGYQLSTNWTEFRVINTQPTDFRFDFDDSDPQDRNVDRGQTFGAFTFSYKDLDSHEPMSSEPRLDDDSLVVVKFQIHNKSSGSYEWLDATVDQTLEDGPTDRIYYSVTVDIPINVTTGAWNTSYYNWTFDVYDTYSALQPQSSYYFYNRTRFMIHNNEPIISNLDVSVPEILRNNNVEITFNISDTEDNNPLTVFELNITGPQGATNLTLLDGDISYASGGRKYIYAVNRSAVLGNYWIYLKVSDTDGRVIANASLTQVHFLVKNNIPVVLGVNYSLNGSAMGNIIRDVRPCTVNITVNITDVEDSWLGDNATKTAGGAAPYILLRHDSNYNNSVALSSPHLEPYKLNLTLVWAGNSSNGQVETWKASMTFNYTMNGTGWEEIWYAGELDVELHVWDQDAGRNKTTSTSHPSLLDTIIVINSDIDALVGTLINNDEIKMYSPNWYYFANTTIYESTISFYIFAQDVEGIDHITIWYIPYIQNIGEEIIPVTYTTSNWEYRVIETVPTYVCKLPTADLPAYTEKIEVYTIGIYDTDHGFKPDVTYGQTAEVAHKLGLFITITGVPAPPRGPDIVPIVIITIVSIIGVIGIVFGIVKWRKSTGWKRFLD